MTMTQRREDAGKGWDHIKSNKPKSPTWTMTPAGRMGVRVKPRWVKEK